MMTTGSRLRVCYFNRSYWPDTGATGQLLTELAEDLAAQHGLDVTVVTGYPISANGASLPAREVRNGVTIIRARGTTFSQRQFIGRALNYLTYFLSALWIAPLWAAATRNTRLNDHSCNCRHAWLMAPNLLLAWCLRLLASSRSKSVTMALTRRILLAAPTVLLARPARFHPDVAGRPAVAVGERDAQAWPEVERGPFQFNNFATAAGFVSV